MNLKEEIRKGIPSKIPSMPNFLPGVSRAPKRKKILNANEKKLAIRNALRYFPSSFHSELSKEFLAELEEYGRIYMYRFMPNYKIQACSINELPYKSKEAASIQLMILNNLSHEIAQHPYELITYGGNGSVFQNWAQYLITMKFLSEMTDEQTLVLYSGHPMGLFPSSKNAPRVVVSNGMMIPNYSKKDDLEKFSALGVTQYGQMTAGSFMYIGPQGIVHGTNITLLNAARKLDNNCYDLSGKVFVTAGLGGMSGAQPKACVIAGGICVVAEINEKATVKRHQQKWVDEIYNDLSKLFKRVEIARKNKESISIAYEGNIVDCWEYISANNIEIELGSDQTSLHNPYSGGYYPVGLSFDESNEMIKNDPKKFKLKVQESLIRHVNAINKLTDKGMYFFDYGNAFLLESKKAGADITNNEDEFKYPSYVQDIMGPMCFDYGYGPFRWVCTSNSKEDLSTTDEIAIKVLEDMLPDSPKEIKLQLQDNINWIKDAMKNNLVVGSQARILYADSSGRINIAKAFNKAIKEGRISGPIVLGRDHHDVSGVDSPYRETSNIYDGSKYTADMAIQNVIGDSFRGATWVSIHNGGGVGWGEVINGGFGLFIDGSDKSENDIQKMLFWDVNNGIARRNWARNKEATFAIKRAMENEPLLNVLVPSLVDDKIIENL